MDKISIDTLQETVKKLPEEKQEIILYLADIFKGEEDIINEYVKNELLQ